MIEGLALFVASMKLGAWLALTLCLFALFMLMRMYLDG